MQFFFGGQMGHLAEEVDSVFIFIFLVGLFFFIITQGALIWFAVRYRRRRHAEEAETPYITGNRPLEIVWVVVPSLLLLAIFLYGYVVFRDIRTPPAGAAEINVTAKQWLFVFKYADGRQEINQVHVPMGKPVRFLLTSADVIHGFYLPEFRVKQDILPGRYTDLWVQPVKEGSFDIFCTQYCGTGHSTMRAVMVVMNPQQYSEWAAGEEEKGGAKPLSEKGKELAEKSGCMACHSTDGSAKIGPTWKGLFGSQVTFTDGTTAKADEQFLKDYILVPNVKVIKGFQPVMPAFKGQLSDDDVTAIIEYIKTLK
ncbi:MAG TPA: cytochrome c oxidase subunit II [Geobacteraceae bacterium]|nr:cytochrome c oxidase subunit II [Geobacteraceae bacterium]